MTAPPLHPATFLGHLDGRAGPAAMVAQGTARRVVGLAEGLDPADFEPGDEVLLGHELNVILERAPSDMIHCGETAQFERWTADGRAVLQSRDEQMVVRSAGRIGRDDFSKGDLVRWDRNSWMAFEKLERSKGGHLFLEESPEETFAAIGGLDHQIEGLQAAIRLHLHHKATVRKYGLRRKGSVLLVGPPGTGKTMMARALANWMGRISRPRPRALTRCNRRRCPTPPSMRTSLSSAASPRAMMLCVSRVRRASRPPEAPRSWRFAKVCFAAGTARAKT